MNAALQKYRGQPAGRMEKCGGRESEEVAV